MKLIVFDLDGTLVDEVIFIWHTLHDSLGTDKEWRQIGIDNYQNGTFSYEQWAIHDVEGWKKVNATKQDIINAIAPLRLMPGALETVKELKKQGHKLAIISGSIDIVLDKLLPEYKELFDYVFINKLVYKDDKVESIIPTEYDLKHKADGLKHISEKENIPLSNCIFVGDNHNDIHIAELAGMSIAFNCKSDSLAQISDHVIMEKDLTFILPLIQN